MKINIKNIRVKSICATLFISLFLSCNNGIEEFEKRNTFLSSLANLGNDFLDVFTSFGDMVTDTLGFKAATPKAKVGDYFKTVKEAVEGVKGKLNTIVEDMKSSNNPNAFATEAAVTKLVSEKLTKMIEGAKIVSEVIGNASELLGDVAETNAGAIGDVDNLVKGIKNIVDIVLKNEGNPDAGDDTSSVDESNGNAGAKRVTATAGAGKLFGSDSADTAG
ncbi:Variable outer membrane protein (plasmid) [Borrelia coriaceae ATCC 43381]|uniref:Variable large protein n=1 Tax=Borrelia coriaceae ATCC 43381 TaxID=1408429 RepID=W5T212_9SPIR|nr:Variable outer membrane protein [Borrelia coriaceae ATCC 43381]